MTIQMRPKIQPKFGYQGLVLACRTIVCWLSAELIAESFTDAIVIRDHRRNSKTHLKIFDQHNFQPKFDLLSGG